MIMPAYFVHALHAQLVRASASQICNQGMRIVEHIVHSLLLLPSLCLLLLSVLSHFRCFHSDPGYLSSDLTQLLSLSFELQDRTPLIPAQSQECERLKEEERMEESKDETKVNATHRIVEEDLRVVRHVNMELLNFSEEHGERKNSKSLCSGNTSFNHLGKI